MRYFFIGLLLCLGLTGCTERRQSNLIQAAEERIAQGKYAEATELLRKVIAMAPETRTAVKALYKQGFLQETYLHAYTDALASYNAFTRLSKDTVSVYEVQKRVANIYFDHQSDTDKTIAAYRKLLELNPDSLEADFFQFRLAQAYFQKNEFQLARDEYQSLLDKFPKSSYIARVRFEIGNTYFMEGKNEVAIEALKQVVRNHPQSEYATEAEFQMAECYERMDKPALAIQTFEGIKGRYPASQALDMRIENIRKKLSKTTSSK